MDVLLPARGFGRLEGWDVHPVEFSRACLAASGPSSRWDPEEMSFLSAAEIRLRAERYHGDINDRLSEVL